MTKAVGDFLGTNGIAEEMIRFNGFPFLEKDDHAYNVPASRVMRQDLKTLPVSGLSVKEIGVLLLARNACLNLTRVPSVQRMSLQAQT